MYRVAVITDKRTALSENFNTRGECEDFLLKCMDNEGVKYYRIKNKDTGELVETNLKVYKKKGEE